MGSNDFARSRICNFFPGGALPLSRCWNGLLTGVWQCCVLYLELGKQMPIEKRNLTLLIEP